MPKGWLTETGPRPDLASAYDLTEAATAEYPERTKLNVLASDGTVVFGDSRSRGSMLTARLCQRHSISGRSTWPATAPARRLASRSSSRRRNEGRRPRR
jgi:Circularly permutated YpsA SLOG family